MARPAPPFSEQTLLAHPGQTSYLGSLAIVPRTTLSPQSTSTTPPTSSRSHPPHSTWLVEHPPLPIQKLADIRLGNRLILTPVNWAVPGPPPRYSPSRSSSIKLPEDSATPTVRLSPSRRSPVPNHTGVPLSFLHPISPSPHATPSPFPGFRTLSLYFHLSFLLFSGFAPLGERSNCGFYYSTHRHFSTPIPPRPRLTSSVLG